MTDAVSELLHPDLTPIAQAIQADPASRTGWDMAVTLCSDALEAKDAAYWLIGDAANLIASNGRYGENAIGKFAEDIGERVTRVRELRTVARFWHFQRRQKFLDTPLKYSHFRTAMRLKDDAEPFLESCLENNWKPEAAYVEMRKHLGKRVPPVTLLEAVGTLAHYDPTRGTLTLTLESGVNWWPLENARGTALHIVIKEQAPCT